MTELKEIFTNQRYGEYGTLGGIWVIMYTSGKLLDGKNK